MATTKDTPTPEGFVTREEYDALFAAFKQANTPQPIPGTAVPHHGAGIGLEVAQTWSKYDQDLANEGLHPHQNGAVAPWHPQAE